MRNNPILKTAVSPPPASIPAAVPDIRAIRRIAVDVDGTLIQTSALSRWAAARIRHVRRPFRDAAEFFLRTGIFGMTSLALDRLSRATGAGILSEYAVRMAWRAFRGVPAADLYRLTRLRTGSGDWLLRLEPAVFRLLSIVLGLHSSSGAPAPKIELHSQGAGRPLIRCFLKRNDVAARFREMGIMPEELRICANEPEIISMGGSGKTRPPLPLLNERMTDGAPAESAAFAVRDINDGMLTGGVLPPVHTKWRRVRRLPPGTLFIGDRSDGPVFARSSARGIYFLCWKDFYDI